MRTTEKKTKTKCARFLIIVDQRFIYSSYTYTISTFLLFLIYIVIYILIYNAILNFVSLLVIFILERKGMSGDFMPYCPRFDLLLQASEERLIFVVSSVFYSHVGSPDFPPCSYIRWLFEQTRIYMTFLKMGRTHPVTRTSFWLRYIDDKNEIGGSCSAYGGKRGVYRAWWGNLREIDHLEDPGIDGRIILRWIFRKWNGEHGLE